MRWSELKREPCSVARTGRAVIGDRWTLLILRDCFLRVRRFEFQARLGITRHVLADRLRKLVRAGVLREAIPKTVRDGSNTASRTRASTCIRCCWPSCTGATCICPARPAGQCCVGM